MREDFLNAGAARHALWGPAALDGSPPGQEGSAPSTHPSPHTAACATQAHHLAPVLSQASAKMPPGAGHIAGTRGTEVLLVVLTQAQEVSDLQSLPLGGQTREQQAQHVEDGQSQQPRLGPVCLLKDTAPNPSPRRPQLKRAPLHASWVRQGSGPSAREAAAVPTGLGQTRVGGEEGATLQPPPQPGQGSITHPWRHLPSEAPGFPCV